MSFAALALPLAKWKNAHSQSPNGMYEVLAGDHSSLEAVGRVDIPARMLESVDSPDF